MTSKLRGAVCPIVARMLPGDTTSPRPTRISSTTPATGDRADADLGPEPGGLRLQGVDILLLLTLDLGQVVVLLGQRRLELDLARVGGGDIEPRLIVLRARHRDLEPAHQTSCEQVFVARQDFLEPDGAYIAGRDLLLGRRQLAVVGGVAPGEFGGVSLLQKREIALKGGDTCRGAGEPGVQRHLLDAGDHGANLDRLAALHQEVADQPGDDRLHRVGRLAVGEQHALADDARRHRAENRPDKSGRDDDGGGGRHHTHRRRDQVDALVEPLRRAETLECSAAKQGLARLVLGSDLLGHVALAGPIGSYRGGCPIACIRIMYVGRGGSVRFRNP